MHIIAVRQRATKSPANPPNVAPTTGRVEPAGPTLAPVETDSLRPDPMYRKTSLRLTNALYEGVAAEAERQGIPASDLWRDVMTRYLAYEAGRRGDDEEMHRTIRELIRAEREERGG